MKTIQSFTKDHLLLNRGIYASIDKGITTIDLRLRIPYLEDTLPIEVIHTMEHVYATVARDLYPEDTVYVGPMGCRTGFYFLFRADVIKAVEMLKYVLKKTLEVVQIPGNKIEECGFALDFSDSSLKKALEETLYIISHVTEDGRIQLTINKDEFIAKLNKHDDNRVKAIYETLLKRAMVEFEPQLLTREQMLQKSMERIEQLKDLFE